MRPGTDENTRELAEEPAERRKPDLREILLDGTATSETREACSLIPQTLRVKKV